MFKRERLICHINNTNFINMQLLQHYIEYLCIYLGRGLINIMFKISKQRRLEFAKCYKSFYEYKKVKGSDILQCNLIDYVYWFTVFTSMSNRFADVNLFLNSIRYQTEGRNSLDNETFHHRHDR